MDMSQGALTYLDGRTDWPTMQALGMGYTAWYN
jgi:hypothetical protein